MTAEDRPQAEDLRRNQLEAASRVAAGLLHEMRNVLNPIVSAAWLVEANARDPEKVIELARRIDGFARADARLAAKIQELLDREEAGLPTHPVRPDDRSSAS